MRVVIDTNVLVKTKTSRSRSLAEALRLTEVIAAPPLPQPVCRDPDDDQVLALAVAGRVEWIVAGDADLLSLGSFGQVPIITPAESVKRIRSVGEARR